MKEQETMQMPDQKCTNMYFLMQLTKGNPEMIIEMIQVYLEETPKLINNMKQGIDNMDWDLLSRTAHGLIPSFATMGMRGEFADMTRKIQEYASKKEKLDMIKELFREIVNACSQACEEMEQKLILLEKKEQENIKSHL